MVLLWKHGSHITSCKKKKKENPTVLPFQDRSKMYFLVTLKKHIRISLQHWKPKLNQQTVPLWCFSDSLGSFPNLAFFNHQFFSALFPKALGMFPITEQYYLGGFLFFFMFLKKLFSAHPVELWYNIYLTLAGVNRFTRTFVFTSHWEHCVLRDTPTAQSPQSLYLLSSPPHAVFAVCCWCIAGKRVSSIFSDDAFTLFLCFFFFFFSIILNNEYWCLYYLYNIWLTTWYPHTSLMTNNVIPHKHFIITGISCHKDDISDSEWHIISAEQNILDNISLSW